MRDILDECRLVSRVMHHWHEMATGQRFPRKDDIDSWLVGGDWANCMLLKLEPEIERSAFYVAGANLLPPRHSLDGAPLSALPNRTLLAPMLEALPRCLAAAPPLSLAGSTIHPGTRPLSERAAAALR